MDGLVSEVIFNLFKTRSGSEKRTASQRPVKGRQSAGRYVDWVGHVKLVNACTICLVNGEEGDSSGMRKFYESMGRQKWHNWQHPKEHLN